MENIDTTNIVVKVQYDIWRTYHIGECNFPTTTQKKIVGTFEKIFHWPKHVKLNIEDLEDWDDIVQYNFLDYFKIQSKKHPECSCNGFHRMQDEYNPVSIKLIKLAQPKEVTKKEKT
jgi:hypothetical protein